MTSEQGENMWHCIIVNPWKKYEQCETSHKDNPGFSLPGVYTDPGGTDSSVKSSYEC